MEELYKKGLNESDYYNGVVSHPEPIILECEIKRLFSSCSLSAIRLVYSAYLRLLMFLQPVFIPACNSSSLAFLMMCSACRLNKQGDNRQPCCTPFPILNQLVVTYRVLTVVSWHTYRFLREQVRWSGIPISLRAFHSLLWSTQSKALA